MRRTYEPLNFEDEVSEDEPNEFELSGDQEVRLDFDLRQDTGRIYESIEDEIDLVEESEDD